MYGLYEIYFRDTVNNSRLAPFVFDTKYLIGLLSNKQQLQQIF